MTHRIFGNDLFGPQVRYGFFGRGGGVSEGVFNSLNCSLHSGDVMAHILENRRRVAAALIESEVRDLSVNTLKQIHSSECFVGSCALQDGQTEGDALVSDAPDEIIGVLTADCAPVLFAGTKPNGDPVVGAGHAGWGGALKGVCERTILEMEKLGARKETIVAAIGPCIGVKSYEVGPDFKMPFLDHNPLAEQFFIKINQSVHFDLESYVADRLEKAGIKTIRKAGKNTYTLENDYFSFRRATHRGEQNYGRQLSVISCAKVARR